MITTRFDNVDQYLIGGVETGKPLNEGASH
jgi:hypothetical protein